MSSLGVFVGHHLVDWLIDCVLHRAVEGSCESTESEGQCGQPGVTVLHGERL